jgi:hypothetical protein
METEYPKQLSFADHDDEERRKSWEELLPHSRTFLQGVHPDSPPPPKPTSPYLKLLRALKQDQKDRFAPAKKLGE